MEEAERRVLGEKNRNMGNESEKGTESNRNSSEGNNGVMGKKRPPNGIRGL